MFGINPSEFIVLLVVAAVVLGPERLPEYAQQLTRLIRELRRMAQGASAQVREELGPEFDDIDWRKLDPRQYDPRRIVRDALSDVWDPDDPLGMKDLTDDPLGLNTDTHVGTPDDPPVFSNPARYGASDVLPGENTADPDPADVAAADVAAADVAAADVAAADVADVDVAAADVDDVAALKPKSPGGPQPVSVAPAFDPDAT